MTTLILILTLQDPHGSKPYPGEINGGYQRKKISREITGGDYWGINHREKVTCFRFWYTIRWE